MSDKGSPEKPSKEEVRARLKAFLQQGASEDIASVLVHTLNQRAENMAEANRNKPKAKRKSNKKPIKPTGK